MFMAVDSRGTMEIVFSVEDELYYWVGLCVEADSNTSTVALQVVGEKEKRTQYLGV
jgi:hypothetical protein